jgi:hypothetical protein
MSPGYQVSGTKTSTKELYGGYILPGREKDEVIDAAGPSVADEGVELEDLGWAMAPRLTGTAG